MKIKNIRKSLLSLTFIALMAFFLGCSDERDTYEKSKGNKETSLNFTVRIPVPAVPKTYALTSVLENDVKDINILLFNGAGYTGLNLVANTITTNAGDVSVKTFTVKVPEGTYDMVMLANCQDILDALPAGSLTNGATKATVLGLLSVSGAPWDTDPTSANYKPIPMWGELAGFVVNQTTPAQNSVDLVRMLSKINVSVDAGLRANFKLNSIRLYNYRNQGRVAPLAANWNTGLGKVTAPSVVGAMVAGPLVYNVATPFAEYLEEIYAFEAAAGTGATLGTNTCLVIGGKYNGEANETFYRVDFANTAGATPTYLPLLRNHSYRINIKQIEASGYATAALAFAAKPINLVSDFVVWDDAKIRKIAYDGQYLLGVSDDKITLTREARTATSTDNTLSVTTDVPGGWSLDKIVDGGGTAITWLKLSASNGAVNVTTDVKLLLDENTTGASRSGFIHLKAGRLTFIVEVVQTMDVTLVLNLRNATNTMDVSELAFPGIVGVAPTAQSVVLSWMPTDKVINVTTQTIGTSAFAYAATSNKPGTGTETSYTSGSRTLSIQPATIIQNDINNDPFLSKVSQVDFTLVNGSNYTTKSLILRQQVYNLVVNQTTSYYPMNGSTYTLNVRSNANWKIKSVTESVAGLLALKTTDNLRSTTTGGVNTGTGTPVTFTVSNNLSLSGTLTVVFESTDSPQLFNDVTVTLSLTDEYYPSMHNGWAGSNIYWDTATGRLTFDDKGVTTHENYQGVFFQWGGLWGMSPDTNYTGTSTLYSPNGGSGAANSYGYGTWDTSPHVSSSLNITSNPPTGKTEKDRAYLYEFTKLTNGIGDICLYMSLKGWAPGSPATKWRLPTASEFGIKGNYDPWSSSNGTGLTQNIWGTGQLTGGIRRNDLTHPYYPGSNFLLGKDGTFNTGGQQALYHSSSPSGLSSYMLRFSILDYIAVVNNPNPRSYGTAVRCVID